MDFQEKLARINELAKKSKEEGLTDAEKAEQKERRQEYLQTVRESFTEQFKTMTVMDEEGQDVTPKKVQELQKNNKRKK